MKIMKRPSNENPLERIKRIWLFILLVGAMTSCMEYTSYYPIGKPKERTIKSKLLGDWQYISGVDLRTKKELGYGAHFMRVSPFSEQEYLVQLVSDSIESLRDVDQFRGFTTTLADAKFANLSPINNEGNRPVFSIYKYRLKKDSLIFQGISEDTFDTLNVVINSIGQHKKFIKKSLKKPEWWDREYKYIRRKK